MEKQLLIQAWRKRKRMQMEQTDTFRLFDGAADGIPGVYVDCFNGHLLISTESKTLPVGAEQLIDGDVRGVRSVWWKPLAAKAQEQAAPKFIAGKKVSGKFVIQENDIRYLVDFKDGYSQGIFLDQRTNRDRVRRRSKGRTVLNLFAYTCPFSVAVAVGGGLATSLDLSARYLDRGKENFWENGIDPEEHYFCKGDAFDWLQRFQKSGRTFDGLILDPPTFSRAGKGAKMKTFRVEKDYAELVQLAAPLVNNGGWMLCCTNFRGINSSKFRSMIGDGMRDAGRRWVAERLPMPPEYSNDPYLKSEWVELG